MATAVAAAAVEAMATAHARTHVGGKLKMINKYGYQIITGSL